MKHRILATVFSAWTFSAATGALAAPAVHPFEQPPMFAQEGLRAAAAAGLRPSSCNPSGSLSRDGAVVSVKLELVRGPSKINNPDNSAAQGDDPLELRQYGGCKSGPVIEAYPGDTLSIELINKLSSDDPSCAPNPPKGLGVPPGVGCYNTTNLHTHGLHVSPAGNSDNVLLDIAPQSTFPYEVNIPTDHWAGTFWYHAHRHGSTAVNVTSGGNGVLIIRGKRPYTPPTKANPHPMADIDTILHDRAGKPLTEQLFLFQQIAYACFKVDPKAPWQQMHTEKGLNSVFSKPTDPSNWAPWTCPRKPLVSPGVVENFAIQLDSPSIWDTNGRFTSINGIVQPTLTVPAGQIQRWRMVHAGIHDTINVQIVRVPPGADRKKLIANSALTGNRLEQKDDVMAACVANGTTLIPQFEIANDGVTRTAIHKIYTVDGAQQSNFLQPGYRSDVLVAFPEEGDYCLIDQAAPPNMRINRKTGQGEGPGGIGGGQGPSAPQLLAYVKVRGGTPVAGDLQDYIEKALYEANPQLPAPVRSALLTGDLAPWAPFLPSKAKLNPTQQAFFSITGTPLQTLFQVNGVSYDPNVINITRQVNTTDDWVLNANGEPHIFHIHVNPFEVVDVVKLDSNGNPVGSIYGADGKCIPSMLTDQQQLVSQYCGMKGVFRDTLFVENGYNVYIRTTYKRYIGEYVLHCHILDHEDGGMMLNVAIVPDLAGAAKARGHSMH